MAALHRKVSKRAPGRANRVLAVVSHMMNFAERPHVDPDGERVEALRPQYSNPARGVARNHEEPRQRYLSAAEVARLAAVLERHPERTSVALTRFLLLTGARCGEAASATWDQFDLERGTWTKPSAHTKQKRKHAVPLSAPALALLAELREREHGRVRVSRAFRPAHHDNSALLVLGLQAGRASRARGSTTSATASPRCWSTAARACP